MTTTTIYRSAAGRAAVLAAYDRGVAGLGFAATSRTVDTRFGPTHMLIAGPEDAPPLLVIHGANGAAWQMAAALPGLTTERRCHFVDVPGEPNRSSEARPGKRGDGLGRWLADVLGGLALERAALLGMSGGAYAVLRGLAAVPGRVTHAVLLVPEGLSQAPRWGFFRDVVVPLLRYRLAPGPTSLRRVLAGLMGVPAAEVPAPAMAAFGLCLDHVRTIVDRGPPLTADELAGYTGPVLVVAAGRDVVFPGEAAAARAQAIFRGPVEVIHLPAAGHVHPDVMGAEVQRRVREFLRGA